MDAFVGRKTDPFDLFHSGMDQAANKPWKRGLGESPDPGRSEVMDNSDLPTGETPQETADRVAASPLFGVTDEASRRRVIRQCLLAIPWIVVLVPLIFYLDSLRYGRAEVGPLGWGMTVFFVMYCLLTAIGLFFRPRTEFHSPVRLRGDWADRVGAFWLVSCAFGPFFGWIVTTGIIPITPTSWRWLYGLQVFLAAGVPLLLTLPLTRYVRGKSTLVALPMLVFVTLLPVLTALTASQDLWEGPVVSSVRFNGQPVWRLKHTGVELRSEKAF